MTSFVMKLSQEVEQFHLGLTTGAAPIFSDKPKLYKMAPSCGRSGTINTWDCHRDTYVANATTDEALIVATSYFQGEAFSSWQMYAK